VPILPSLYQPISDTPDRLDAEAAAGDLSGDLAQAGEDTVNRILADGPAFPAGFDQLVAGNDPARIPSQRDQHLHDSGLQRFLAIAVSQLAGRRIDRDFAENERRFVGKPDSCAVGAR
jgi:hypothetical protein